MDVAMSATTGGTIGGAEPKPGDVTGACSDEGDASEVSMSVEEARRRLHAVYTLHLPSKLHAIPGLLSKYKGQEAEIVGKVEDKYLSPPTSAAALLKQNKRMKAARALVQQKAVIARSWCLWYDDMRAGIPPKLWPLPGEAVVVDALTRATLPANHNLRCEPGGAAEWLANGWPAWAAAWEAAAAPTETPVPATVDNEVTAPPKWFTPQWMHAIPAQFRPPGVTLPPLPPCDEEDAPTEGKGGGEPENFVGYVGPRSVTEQPPPPPPQRVSCDPADTEAVPAPASAPPVPGVDGRSFSSIGVGPA